MRLILTALAAAAVAGPALAALAPEYYQQARNQAPDVVVLTVSRTDSDGSLSCKVSGRIKTVERGTAYKVGDPITLRVPCMGPGDEVPAGPAVYQTKRDLAFAHGGRAWLAANGELALSQYEILP